MKARTLSFQQASDNFIDKIFLRFIPHNIRPNHVTVIRFIFVPIVYLLLINNQLGWALWIFVIAACTDFIDGAMARTRDQITDLGKIIDPIADKLLIATVLAYVGFEYLIVKIFIFIIIFELIAVLFGALFSVAIGKPVGANVFGKMKMILQSFGVAFFILGLTIKADLIITVSEYILFAALIFAIISGLEHIRLKINKRLLHKK